MKQSLPARMRGMVTGPLRILCALVALVLAGTTAAPAAMAESGRRLVLGRISNEPHKHMEQMRAMAGYLAEQLADQGVSGVDVVFAESPTRMLGLLHEGRIDLFSETAFVALEFISANMAKPLLREWKKGAPEYHSVILVRRDSGLTALSELVGGKFAFEDSGSTSGYLMPRAALEEAGLQLAALTDPRNPTPDNMLGYGFAQGEINVIAWVNRGLADAGAISNLDWEDPDTAPARLKDELHILHETEPVIRSLFMARRSLDDELCARISALLEHMHESPEGRAVLKKYYKVARYDRIEGDARTGLEAARAIWRRHREHSD
ncbi:MAG: phosphate/phosphite/phosphonate ABC transporter substrate-binding protein [Rhodospirillales bacterium]|nr:MAG: phosphate/phosphite/phosphonate ABC transporter substrate-binding protein [Rhodospirillales bacterium]